MLPLHLPHLNLPKAQFLPMLQSRLPQVIGVFLSLLRLRELTIKLTMGINPIRLAFRLAVQTLSMTVVLILQLILLTRIMIPQEQLLAQLLAL